MKTKITKIIAVMALLFVSLSSLAGVVYAQTYSQITAQLDFGDRGANVTSLQAFLATNPAIYPESLVTGYFGSLTRAAVIRFQTAYEISPVGRVGPMTLARINSLIAAGMIPGGGTAGDMNAPTIAALTVTPSRTSVVTSWVTNKPAKAEVYYNTVPFQLGEAQVGSQKPIINGGSKTPEIVALNTSHTFTIQSLQPNTTYYYMALNTDSSGNVSVTLPRTFKTNP